MQSSLGRYPHFQAGFWWDFTISDTLWPRKVLPEKFSKYLDLIMRLALAVSPQDKESGKEK